MIKGDAKKRISKLKDVIDENRYKYHVLDEQDLSDDVLDSLKKELFDLELQFPELVTTDSPTQRVGGERLEKFEKVVRDSDKPMHSLHDAFSRQDMIDWRTRVLKQLSAVGQNYSEQDIDFHCDLKIDGLAVELVYKRGILVLGSTRGDGTTGENVTENIKTIEAIPLVLRKKPPETLTVRGEIFLRKNEFIRINKEQREKGLSEYANPRNVAAGSIRQLDPKITASRKLDFFAYGIVSTKPGQYSKHSDERDLLKKYGFKVNSFRKVAKDLEGVFKYYNDAKKERKKLDFEIDGVVVLLNDNKLYELAGYVGKGPRAAMAFKFAPKEAETIIEDVSVQIGRTGTLTPVAKLRPVNVGGVVISHASLHNFDEIKRLDVKIGDTVIVHRAGDVIPKVVRVIKGLRSKNERKIPIPQKCPICDSIVIKDKGGVYLKCKNKNCAAQQKERIYHFVSRSAFDIQGVGPRVVDKFLQEGLIQDASDLFILNQEDIAVLEQYGDLSAKNIIQAIQESKNIFLPRFLISLGIEHIGEETAHALSGFILKNTKPKTPKQILDIFLALKVDDLKSINDIGQVVAKSIVDYFNKKKNQGFIKKLNNAGISFVYDNNRAGQKLSGKSFLFTGTLSFMNRDEAKERIRQLGGKVVTSVSSDTDFLVAGEKAGSKLEKARKKGVKIINEREFKSML